MATSVEKRNQRRGKKQEHFKKKSDHSASSNGTKSRSLVPKNASTKFIIVFFVMLACMMLVVNLAMLQPLEHALGLQPSSSSQKQQQQQQEQQKHVSRMTEEEGREHIKSIFKDADVELTAEMMDELPTWEQIQTIVGDGPRIYGLDRCQAFQDSVPPIERMLGSAGMFNTGTNLVTHLLKRNCEIPERRAKYGEGATKEQYGMRWQVPWGKHTPAKFRLQHHTEKASAIKKEYLMPIVTIRSPYTWFPRMCTNGYTARWQHGRSRAQGCPNLLTPDGEWNQVSTRYANDRGETHQSLAHLWNDWYNDYIQDADYPFVVVRIEDLTYYAKETTTAICECAGGRIRTDQPFQYVIDSAKADSRGHDSSVGFFEAWMKHIAAAEPQAGLQDDEYQASIRALDKNLMEFFAYKYPPKKA